MHRKAGKPLYISEDMAEEILQQAFDTGLGGLIMTENDRL